MKFEKALETEVDVKKININVIKPWITQKITSLLGMEDDVVCEYVFTQLEEKQLNPKQIQINLTGFLNARRSREFMGELWEILIEAQKSPDGIPMSLVEKKIEELKTMDQKPDDAVAIDLKDTSSNWNNRYQSLTYGKYKPQFKNEDDDDEPSHSRNRNDSPRDRHRNRRNRDRSDSPVRRRRRDRSESPERRRRGRDDDREHRRDRKDRKRSRSPRRERKRSRTPEKRKSRSSSPEETEKRKRRTRSPDDLEKRRHRSRTPEDSEKRSKHRRRSRTPERKEKKKKEKKSRERRERSSS